MRDRAKERLPNWGGVRRDGWVFPSSRSKTGHLTTTAKLFQEARKRTTGLVSRVFPYSAGHGYLTYTMERNGNAFAEAKSVGRPGQKSMEPYPHQELGPIARRDQPAQ